MAKPKKSVLVQSFVDNSIEIWCDDHIRWTEELMSIEGVSMVTAFPDKLSLMCDPRYDQGELMQEIEELLTSEIPDVFRDIIE
jgi:hypothetical protein